MYPIFYLSLIQRTFILLRLKLPLRLSLGLHDKVIYIEAFYKNIITCLKTLIWGRRIGYEIKMLREQGQENSILMSSVILV